MGTGEDRYDSFATAAEDPYLGALLGTIDEPGGTSTANRVGLLTRAWWDQHGTGPSCIELLEAVFDISDWDAAIGDTGRTLLERNEQLDLLQRWLISYWSRLGTIAYIPGHDDVIRPGRVIVTVDAEESEPRQAGGLRSRRTHARDRHRRPLR